MKNLITGAAGSGASYLAEKLINFCQEETYGLVRWHSTSSTKNLENVADKIKLVECDLCDLSSVIRALNQVKPTHIYNLAAHANVRVCFDNPIAVFQNNVNATLNLFEAIRLTGLNCKVHHISTSECVGNPKETPIMETTQIDPVNIYAVSKVAQEKIASSYWHSYKIPTIITRTFAYINPRRGDIFSSIFARQIVEIEKGKRVMLEHGNLDSVRTLMDVRDVSTAYILATEFCIPGEIYNIGGNSVISVGQFLERLKSRAKCEVITKVNPKLLRPVDVTSQIPNCDKFRWATGFQPSYTLNDSIDFLLDYYRQEIK